ncbi:MAG: hypothetical protein LUG16_06490 [Candidatus Gastranaerophilales bacterium]|nr:hypothetical protein [Candidatus Gastranaerophilales bacterium]
MSYALFACHKRVLDSQLNSAQLQQTQRSNEQFKLATNTTSLNQQLSSLTAAQSSQLSDLYSQLSSEDDSTARSQISNQIQALEAQFDQEKDQINQKIYEVSIKENAIEMEVKRLDTVVTTLQQQLSACEEAEAQGIQTATPKYKGLG